MRNATHATSRSRTRTRVEWLQTVDRAHCRMHGTAHDTDTLFTSTSLFYINGGRERVTYALRLPRRRGVLRGCAATKRACCIHHPSLVRRICASEYSHLARHDKDSPVLCALEIRHTFNNARVEPNGVVQLHAHAEAADALACASGALVPHLSMRALRYYDGGRARDLKLLGRLGSPCCNWLVGGCMVGQCSAYCAAQLHERACETVEGGKGSALTGPRWRTHPSPYPSTCTRSPRTICWRAPRDVACCCDDVARAHSSAPSCLAVSLGGLDADDDDDNDGVSSSCCVGVTLRLPAVESIEPLRVVVLTAAVGRCAHPGTGT
jgi:hypothetical protein